MLEILEILDNFRKSRNCRNARNSGDVRKSGNWIEILENPEILQNLIEKKESIQDT